MLLLNENVEVTKIKDNSIILDIETTGVSRIHSKVLVVGILDSFGIFNQFAIEDFDEEVEMLKAIKPYLDQKHIITFNGKHFDIPFLKARYKHFEIEHFEEKSQFDIYRYLISNKLYTDIDYFSLQDIEKYENINRFEDFELEDDITFYNEINDNNLSKILVHNKYDVINTEKILKLVGEIEKIKIFNFNDKNVKIKNLEINKNFLLINIDAYRLQFDHNYETSNYNIKWIDNKIDIKLKIIEGYIDDNTIGYVFPSNRANSNNGKYNIPKNIFLISDGRYYIENIINIIKDLLEYYIK